MGGDITDARVHVPFPKTLYTSIHKAQVDDKVKFVHASIDQIIKLFDGNLDAVTWNRLKLEHFLIILDRQSRELQKCVSSASKYEKRLNRYFRKLKKNILKQRKYDAHSWELIRKEVLRHLQRLDLIMAATKTSVNPTGLVEKPETTLELLFLEGDSQSSQSGRKATRSPAQDFCDGCNWIQHGFRRVSGESLSLLSEMGGDITDARVHVPFPKTLYTSIHKAQVDDKVKFLHEFIDQIIKLFDGNLDAVTWNRLKLTHFRAALHRQSGELQKCVSSASKYEKRLNRYFRKLKKNVLKQKKYDAHSWELIRREVLRHLKMLDLISAAMKAPVN
ncbi:uncharacterized protein LOC118217093 [Anguilla anguilla]|nr:uncharacterized protein LOC118217093 [Anguilla anguilla]